MIKIIGIGGGGCNVISSLMTRMYDPVEFIAVNSDKCSLNKHTAKHKILLSDYGVQHIAKFMSLSDYPEHERKTFGEHLINADEVIIITCLGGEAGSRLAPVFAELANEMNISCSALLSLPFEFEGERRIRIANLSIQKVKQFKINSIKVISNAQFLKESDYEGSLLDLLNEINKFFFESLAKGWLS